MYSFAVRSPIRLANRGGCGIGVRGASCEVITYQMNMPGTFGSQNGGPVPFNERHNFRMRPCVHNHGSPRQIINQESSETSGKLLWMCRMTANSFQSAPMPGATRSTAQINFWRSAITRTTRKPDMRRHCFVRLDASLLIVYKTCNAVGAFTDLTGANIENR